MCIFNNNFAPYIFYYAALLYFVLTEKSIYNIRKLEVKFKNSSKYHVVMSDTDLKTIFASNVQRLRKRKGYTQEVFSEKASLSVSGLCEIETGVNFPRHETITNIAKALEVEPCELFVDIKKCVKMKNHKEALKLLEKCKNNEIKTAIAHDFLKLLDMLE